jgi:dTDP-4-dehydrorhamnose reductase
MSLKILLLGKNGQLGWELSRTLSCLGTVEALDFPEIDFTHPEDLAALVASRKPAVVINAAAYTAVDRAESEPDLAYAVNASAPGVLAKASRQVGAVFIHYSTDYVFDGQKSGPYTEADTPNPVNVYAQSKLQGEQAVQADGHAYLILRTSWVYTTRRDSFVTKVLQWSRSQKVLRVVADQVGSPTWARALAEISAQLLARGMDCPQDWFEERQGLYHLGGSGSASRYEWAQRILNYDPHPEEQVVKELIAASTDQFPTPARRPLATALDCSKFMLTFGLTLPSWESTLKLAME